MDRPVVLCGLGRVGWRVLESLRAAGLPVAAVDPLAPPDDPRLAGVRVVRGDCRRAEVLEAAGVRDAGGVVIATGDDLANVTAALLVRRLNPGVRVVVRMFNPEIVARLGPSVGNVVALSVSALTAPLLALTAATGEALGAFKLPAGPQQVAELVVAEGSEAVGRRLADFVDSVRVLPLAFAPLDGPPRFLLDVPGERLLAVGDRLTACAAPADLRPLLERARGDLPAGLRWAGALRRWLRTLRSTAADIDLPVKVCTVALFSTFLVSTLIFRFGIGTTWVDGLYRTVTIAATGTELRGERSPEWEKVFLSVLKVAGAALLAAFTAVFTNYLIRARLGGALDVRRVPDGGHVVVCGLGNIGYRCVEELAALGERVVAIDRANDNPFIATCRRQGVAAFVGDATVAEVLRQARADTAKAVIAATGNELVNLGIALHVRDMNPTQRLVVRLSDPQFALALRESADIGHALAVPSLAAPAFVAALFGDRVQTLVSAAGRTLVVVDLTVPGGDPCLAGASLRAAMLDYRFVALSVGDLELTAGGLTRGHRLKAGDRMTLVSELHDLERLLRREVAPRGRAVVVERLPVTAREALIPLVRSARKCGQAEAEAVLKDAPFELAADLTLGEAEELVAQVARDRVTARVV